ncbi:MAG TPA: cytochrome c [Longimicrobiales bacterium]|nr:cytochrome c [Longimicrobiales bacterium]
MRQQLAVWAAVTCIALVAFLALGVARRVNPDTPVRERVVGAEPGGDSADRAIPDTSQESAPPSSVERGHRVYDASGCSLCHAVAGRGNPRNPLDGVGTRRDREGLRAWIVAEAAVADSLSPSALRRKRSYGSLPEEDLEALIDYLASLPAS